MAAVGNSHCIQINRCNKSLVGRWARAMGTSCGISNWKDLEVEAPPPMFAQRTEWRGDAEKPRRCEVVANMVCASGSLSTFELLRKFCTHIGNHSGRIDRLAVRWIDGWLV